MDVMKFLQWRFRGSLRSLSFWGFMLFVAATVMLLLDWSTALFAAVVTLALGLVILDAGISWFRLSYSLYENEQQQIERRLKD